MIFATLELTWINCFLFINILLVLSVVFWHHKTASTTWAWIMIMLFIPILGFILYILCGQDLRKQRTFNKKAEQDRFLAVKLLQEISFKQPLSQYTNPLIIPYKNLITMNLISHDSLYTEDNEVTLYTDGNELFTSLFHAINCAQHYIHIEYYIIHDDELGKLFKDLLIKKANQGVDIFLLYDEVGSLKTPKKYFYDLKRAGIKTAHFYSTAIPFIKLHANYRNHRKICVVDGKVGFIGGFNVGAEYLGLNKKFGYWRDTHLRIEGSSVDLINLQFLLDRRFATKENLNLEQYIPLRLPKATNKVGIQIVSSGPDSKYPSIRNAYMTMINLAKKSIYIQTPYFIPDDGVLTALKLACLSGLDVRIMIPNKPDHMFVYWATYAHVGELIACGCKCYTYEHGFLHAKTIVVDEEICSVGTANFDIRSFNLNFEINAFIYNKPLAEQLMHIFNEDLTLCNELTPTLYAHRSYLIKFKESISRLISPIL
nr:cardiolipin synthase [uncultured Cellulosilyticum sp.]